MSEDFAVYGSKAYRWLVVVPSCDVNFKHALKEATDNDLRQAVAHLKTLPASKTAIKACERELRRRSKKKVEVQP